MSLRSRITGHESPAAAGTAGAPGSAADSTGHLVPAYRAKLLEEIDLAEMSALSPAERRAPAWNGCSATSSAGTVRSWRPATARC